jgi:hypothetical protein
MEVSNARSYTEAAGFCEGTGDLVFIPRKWEFSLGIDEPAGRRECNSLLNRETAGNFLEFGRSRRNIPPRNI